jgi:hypothetical protein
VPNLFVQGATAFPQNAGYAFAAHHLIDHRRAQARALLDSLHVFGAEAVLGGLDFGPVVVLVVVVHGGFRPPCSARRDNGSQGC